MLRIVDPQALRRPPGRDSQPCGRDSWPILGGVQGALDEPVPAIGVHFEDMNPFFLINQKKILIKKKFYQRFPNNHGVPGNPIGKPYKNHVFLRFSL